MIRKLCRYIGGLFCDETMKASRCPKYSMQQALQTLEVGKLLRWSTSARGSCILSKRKHQEIVFLTLFYFLLLLLLFVFDSICTMQAPTSDGFSSWVWRGFMHFVLSTSGNFLTWTGTQSVRTGNLFSDRPQKNYQSANGLWVYNMFTLASIVTKRTRRM